MQEIRMTVKKIPLRPFASADALKQEIRKIVTEFENRHWQLARMDCDKAFLYLSFSRSPAKKPS